MTRQVVCNNNVIVALIINNNFKTYFNLDSVFLHRNAESALNTRPPQSPLLPVYGKKKYVAHNMEPFTTASSTGV